MLQGTMIYNGRYATQFKDDAMKLFSLALFSNITYLYVQAKLFVVFLSEFIQALKIELFTSRGTYTSWHLSSLYLGVYSSIL